MKLLPRCCSSRKSGGSETKPSESILPGYLSTRLTFCLVAIALPSLSLAAQTLSDNEAILPACIFQAGQIFAQTHPDLPHGDQIPIDHIIIVMQENRSFDHLLQAMPAGVDVAPNDAFNVDKNGIRQQMHRAKTPCLPDPPHFWSSAHKQINGGKMKGFATSGGSNAMTHYDEGWLPYYYALANTFSLSDRHFASIPGPTWPNRMYTVSGGSDGHIDNTVPPQADEEKSIFHQLETAGLDWAVFTSSAPSFEEQIFPRLKAEKGEHFQAIDVFLKRAASGKLPAFSWVTSAGEHNEHPPKSVQAGQKFVSDIIGAVMKSPNWPRTALFFTYDEHGGFYDHVPPPLACPPDKQLPELAANDINGAFNQYGPRVPLIVVSPWARKQYVSHDIQDHTSLLRFVQARFDLPARDANATPPMAMFDFSKPAFLIPLTLPEAVIDAAFDAKCEDLATTHFEDEAATGQ